MLGSPPLPAHQGPPSGLTPSSRGPSPVTTPPPPPPTPEGRQVLDLARGVTGAELRGDSTVLVTDIRHRSQEVTPGSLFCCVPGGRRDGHEFAEPAWRAGAVALLVERWLDLPVPQIHVSSVRRAMGPIAAELFGHPSRSLTMVGVTGTNGKTTTTYLLESIFEAAGLSAGVVGTIGVRIAGTPVPVERTTPEATDLQRLLATMRAAGVGAVAMEVSSHGLEQDRVGGTEFGCAVFTNLSQDHLDYHGTMEAYFEAKSKLFTPELSRRAAVGIDGPQGRRLAERGRIPSVTFGFADDADVRATGIEVSGSGLSFSVGTLKLKSRLRGRFNVSNCLGALTAAREVRIDDGAIAAGIERLPGVPGRLQSVEEGQGFAVLVDYAHTPDSLRAAARAARELAGHHRLIVVFGCGGDRDRGKRPLMGAAATEAADLTVITSDNPRSEEPEAIIEEILPGARSGGGRFVVQVDRRLAIRTALQEAGPGDVVLIAGKGHEIGQEFRYRTIPFDDRLVAHEELTELLGGHA
jgi:UDP-N-acetylmuramoyl-L-alanyl-D-glutamate--2,6-diaminopimelate ligase